MCQSNSNYVSGSCVGSRRQSAIPKFTDTDSTCSLQGYIYQRDQSPRLNQRRTLDRTPLYINGDDSYSTIEQPDSLNSTSCTSNNGCSKNDVDIVQKKPLAMVRPRQILCSITSSSDDYQRFRDCIDAIDNQTQSISGLRESLSLDPFPKLRRRFDCIKIPQQLKLRNPISCSLDAGVAMISNDPNCSDLIDYHSKLNSNLYNRALCNSERDDTNDINININKKPIKKNISYKNFNNNCNGNTIGNDDQNCPLLQRQGSLCSPHDEILMHNKRWRSLENVCGNDNIRDISNLSTTPQQQQTTTTNNKKMLSKNSIRSWLVGLFQGNGFRSNDASLRKVGVGLLQSGVLSTAPEHESIV